MWHLIYPSLVLTLLGGCSVGNIVSGPGSGSAWNCTPINPASQSLPSNPCFRAVLSAENEITLQWRVINTQPLVYIYDDFGTGDREIGFQTASCPSEEQNICSVSRRVTQGGFFRWRLEVEDSRGHRVYVPAAITVPSLFPPTVKSDTGIVDVLAPTSRTITWTADTRNSPLDTSIEKAWIEIQNSKHIWLPFWKRLPRSGPESSFTVSSSALDQPGLTLYNVRDCILPEETGAKFCSQPVPVSFYVSGDRFIDLNPLYTDSGKDLAVSFTSLSGDVRRLTSTTLIPGEGEQHYLETEGSGITIDSALLTPGLHTIELQSCIAQTNECSTREVLHVLVDSKMNWEPGREYTDDFLPGTAHTLLGKSQPLDLTYDPDGGIWLISEWANRIEYVAPSGTAESFAVPTAHEPIADGSSLELVKPFALSPHPYGSNDIPRSSSSLGERATLVGSKLWFTQGGGLLADEGLKNRNHSRIISVDPALTDYVTTLYDDRLCVYNVPIDDENPLGNNQVIGLAATPGRIWIGEARGVFGERPSAISSFVPNPDSCDNLLNFNDPAALAGQSLQYCSPDKTPEQDGCMERFLLDDLPPGIKVAHLATDPVDNSIWFTDAHGGYLGNLIPERDPAINLYPLSETHKDLLLGVPGFGGFPWSIRANEEAVYFAEYSTRHILRFDKATKTIDEIRVPAGTSLVTLHSIDIDPLTARLWFTLNAEVPIYLNGTASTIGYIDLASWRAHVANPADGSKILGVIYKGLDAIASSEATPVRFPGLYCGIAVDPASGKIAIATMRRKEVTELTPRAGFRP